MHLSLNTVSLFNERSGQRSSIDSGMGEDRNSNPIRGSSHHEENHRFARVPLGFGVVERCIFESPLDSQPVREVGGGGNGS